MLTTISLAFILFFPQSSDWPQFRGPDRTGHGPEQRLAATGNAEPLWTKNVGLGYSCHSIVGGRLVTIGYDATAGVDRIVCLAAETADEHWSFEFEATDEPKYHGGGTLTTPTISAGLVYCLSRNGKLHVLELETGELVWSKDYMAELGLDQTFHGFSASPLLAEGQILLQLGGLVVAADASDGHVLWQTEDRGEISYSNLARITVGDEEALAGVLGTSFVVLRLADGELLGEHSWPLTGNAVHCATPIQVSEDRVFLSSAYGKGCEMVSLNGEEGPATLWSSRNMRNKVTACVLHKGHLYGFDESMLRCIDLEGKSKWRVRGLGLGSLSIVGDRLLILNSDGELIIAEANSDEFRELSRRKVLEGGVYWTMPVAVDGLIYVRNSLGDMSCLDYRAGATEPGLTTDPTPESLSVSAPAALFERHAKQISGSHFQNTDKALQLLGTWSIPLRGLDKGELSWTLAAPNQWDMRLEGGGLLYTFDGEESWAIEPQGARLVKSEELFESRNLFPLPTLFSPTCPKGASTSPKPIRFAETECWQVVSPMAAFDDQPGHKYHYFELETGALIGSEGDGLSTLVFHEWRSLGGMTLPKSVTRYRAEDGQEHEFVITSAQWIETPAELFELPVTVQRLLRSPAEIEQENAKLRERFAGALARYEPQEKDTPLEDDIIELQVHDGELWFVTPEPEFRIDVAEEKDGVFPIDGPPLRVSLENDEDGQTTVLWIHMLGPGGERLIACDRLTE